MVTISFEMTSILRCLDGVENNGIENKGQRIKKKHIERMMIALPFQKSRSAPGMHARQHVEIYVMLEPARNGRLRIVRPSTSLSRSKGHDTRRCARISQPGSQDFV